MGFAQKREWGMSNDQVKTGEVVQMPTALERQSPRQVGRTFSLVPESLGQAMEMARMLAGSSMVPKDYQGKPENVLVAIQMGLDIGLKPMQALQNIAVINGRPSIWGDAALALVHASELVEYVHETAEGPKQNADGSFPDDFTRVCEVKRKGAKEPVIRKFSVRDAKTAKLWGKTGQQGQPTPWVTYPERMLQMRARSFALRDSASDALMGLSIVEEAQDMNVLETSVVSADHQLPAAPDVFLKVPESLRDNVEKAFALLDLPKGLRLAKLNEFLGAADVDPELGTQALLNWCRDEYAARQGRARVQGPQNSKAPQPPAVDSAATPTLGNSVQASGATTGGDPSRGDSGAKPATAEAVKVAPGGAQAPLTANDIKFGF